jgi:hypothetical protein
MRIGVSLARVVDDRSLRRFGPVDAVVRLLFPLSLLRASGALRSSGWVRSRISGRPLDQNGAPVPWITYGSASLLASLLHNVDIVFEFGAGASTRWFAPRVDRVYSVEHDPAWVADLKTQLAGDGTTNVELLGRDVESTGYVDAISELGVIPDVVVIDATARGLCGSRRDASPYPADNRVRQH